MKIAQIIDTLYVGGAEKMQVYFAAASKSRGHAATIIYLTDSSHSRLPDELRSQGATVVEFSGRNLIDPLRFIRLVKYLRQQKFELIHAHLSYATILGILAGWVTKIPVVVTLHNVNLDYWGKLVIALTRIGAKHVVMVGPSVAEAHRNALSRKKVSVIVNPVIPSPHLSDSERLELRREITSDPSRPLIFSTGRMDPQKGFNYLLLALDILRKKYPTIFLAIAGKGSLYNELLKQIQDLNLEDQVSLLGIRNDVPRLMLASDIYVSSSLWEGMPISILEAMSAGLPIIATKVGDIPFVINDGTGILIPSGNSQAIADKIAYLLDNPSMRSQLGRAGRDYVLTKHSLDAWYDSLMEVYQEALGRS